MKTRKPLPQSLVNLMLWFITIGMLMIALGVVLPLFMGDPNGMTFRYIYTAGALMLLVGRLFTPYNGNDMRLRRLYRIETWSALFFCAGAFFLMFPEYGTFRDCLAFTLAGGAIQIYTSIMIPRRIRKIEAQAETEKAADNKNKPEKNQKNSIKRSQS